MTQQSIFRGSLFISLIVLTCVSLTFAETYPVTNTNDSGAGSLRQAISDAENRAGCDTILFNIPDTDPGYEGTTGVWTILSIAECFRLTKGETIINGCSQTSNQGDRNPLGPEIALDGRQMAVSPYYGFLITSSNNAISGMALLGFKSMAINIYGQDVINNHIFGNYIGVIATGNDTLKNLGGISIGQGSSNNIIGGSKANERNIISGNHVGIVISEAIGNIIQGNFIGTDATGAFALRQDYTGIEIGQAAKKNIIGGLTESEGNLISGNGWYGISIESDADSNQVFGNKIGTDIRGEQRIPNRFGGIRVRGNAQYNQIGPGNIIRHNDLYGILIDGSSSLYNRITRNSIFDNQLGGIDLLNGGNAELPAPVMLTTNPVTGTTTPLATIEIFSDSSNQGRIYEGVVTADAAGNFGWTGSPVGPYVTATATDPSGNTSEFSGSLFVAIDETKAPTTPAEFSLKQNYPNPFNPVTTISYQLSAYSRVQLKIYNIQGQEIRTLIDEFQIAGMKAVVWDGLNDGGQKAPSGVYVYQLKTDSFTSSQKMILLQ